MQGLVLMSQVHGNNITIVDRSFIGMTVPDCDGLITSFENITLGVRVADCLPVLIYCERPKVIGVFHAGWRGLLSKILTKAVGVYKNNFGCAVQDLKVFIGPHICVDHYEIGTEVAKKFNKYEDVLKVDHGRTYLDLSSVAINELTSQGIKIKNIVISPDCTHGLSHLPSFRRDKTDKRLLVQAKLDKKHFGLGVEII